MLKHADCDLTNLLEETSPPIDLQRVAIFRAVCRKFEKEAGVITTCQLIFLRIFKPFEQKA